MNAQQPTASRNRLSNELSPYLLQHADNPVQWYPWGAEAFERAKRENKPILLSIGYSACHWCHVMAHESFEDPDIAAVMNELFVNIKVDREERPDVDHIYQSVHAMMNRRSGGWPLTIFMTPEQAPFYAATYVPKTPRYGMMAFPDLCHRVAAAFRDRQDAVKETTQSIAEALRASLPERRAVVDAGNNDTNWSEVAAQALAESFDPEHGGFGNAPKFLHPMELRFCLEQSALQENAALRHIVLHTLERMSAGGLYDQIGGGFCRYSVDAEWSIPHFEKMLYDNGPLLGLLADAYALLVNDPGRHAQAARTRGVIEQTVDWLSREMTAPNGGLYAALDADSEGEEGKFYVWTPDEVRGVLGPGVEADWFCDVMGLAGPANFEGHTWNLRRVESAQGYARQINVSVDELVASLDKSGAALLAQRTKRIRPGLDDKQLTGWNALAVAGLARAGRLLARGDYVAQAQTVMDFIRRELWREGHLWATHKLGQTRLNAYLDDVAFCLDALIELMQSEFRVEDAVFAKTLADYALDHFEDRDNGGFFFTRHDHESLIVRTKPAHDNATPSGNGVMAHSLAVLGHWFGEARYLDAATRATALFATQYAQYPQGFCSFHRAERWLDAPPSVLVLTGPEVACESLALSASKATSRPDFVIVTGEQGEHASLPDGLRKPTSDVSRAWMCQGLSCLPPVESADELTAMLNQNKTFGLAKT